MAEKKLNREAVNLSMHPVIKSRGLEVARKLGYNFSEFVERMLEEAHQEMHRIRSRKPGDPLQLTLFDRLKPEQKPIKKPRR